MKEIEVRIVESISQEIEQIQTKIRERAYEKFLARADESNRDLEDWFAAERELIWVLTATMSVEEQQIVAQVEIPEIDPKELRIQVTTRDVLIDAGTQEQLGAADTSNRRLPFGVVRFPAEIDPTGLRAEYTLGILRLTAPISGKAKTFKKIA